MPAADAIEGPAGDLAAEPAPAGAITVAAAKAAAPGAEARCASYRCPADLGLIEIDPATIPVGTRLVQFGAFDTADEARAEWARLQGSFGDLMADKGLVVQPAESGGRTFFRLRAHGFEDEDDARRFCSAFVAEKRDLHPGPAAMSAGLGAAIFGCAGPDAAARGRAFFRDADPFGFILFARNVETPDQLRRLTGDLRDAVGRDAPILVDQEGGRVQRLRGPALARMGAAAGHGRPLPGQRGGRAR